MNIDLDTTEGRKQYLSDKLDDLLDGINESYGTVLMEELLNRLELTIRDFNDEMKILCDQLIQKEEERQQLLEMLKSGEGMPLDVSGKKAAVPDQNENPFLEFMSSEIESVTAPTKTDQSVSKPIQLLEEKPEEDIPEWEKKLAKLDKK